MSNDCALGRASDKIAGTCVEPPSEISRLPPQSKGRLCGSQRHGLGPRGLEPGPRWKQLFDCIRLSPLMFDMFEYVHHVKLGNALNDLTRSR